MAAAARRSGATGSDLWPRSRKTPTSALALLLLACVATYSLTASASAPTPLGGTAGTITVLTPAQNDSTETVTVRDTDAAGTHFDLTATVNFAPGVSGDTIQQKAAKIRHAIQDKANAEGKPIETTFLNNIVTVGATGTHKLKSIHITNNTKEREEIDQPASTMSVPNGFALFRLHGSAAGVDGATVGSVLTAEVAGTSIQVSLSMNQTLREVTLSLANALGTAGIRNAVLCADSLLVNVPDEGSGFLLHTTDRTLTTELSAFIF